MPHNWGPVGYSISAGLGLAFDDNTLLVENDPQEDIIVTPNVNLGLNWPITDRTRLTFGVGVGYDIYTQGSRDDRFTLTPNSNLSFDFELGQTLITIYDSFSFSQDLLEQGEARSSENYGGFDNTAGVRAMWAPEPIFLEGGYSWNIFVATDEEFADLNRNSHQVFGRVGQVVAGRTRWGAEVTASRTLYDEPIRNDFNSASVGPFLEWQTTEYLNLSLRGGWTWTVFDDNGLLLTPDDVSVPYMALMATHQLTAAFRHNLSAVREVRVGVNTQYIETFIFDYEFNWQLTDLLGFSAGAYYEIGEEPSFLTTEEYDRIGVTFNLPLQLTDNVMATLGYQFTIRDSNLIGRDYTNNRATVSASYTF